MEKSGQALSPEELGAPLAHTIWRLAVTVFSLWRIRAPEQGVSIPWVYGTLRVKVFRKPGVPASDLDLIFHSP